MDQRTLELLAGLSHELRTPLGAIGGYTELLRLGAQGPMPDAQRELLARILRNQQWAVEILDAVLAYAAASSGGLSLHPVDAQVEAMAQQAADACATVAAGRHVALQVHRDAARVAVTAHVDTAATHVMLTAILRDAIQGAVSSSRIDVTVSADDDVVSVDVTHVPRAITAGSAELLFTPFARGNTQSRVSGDSDTLALPHARALARASGGDVVAVHDASRHVLRLTLPRAPVAVPAAG